MTTPLDLAAVRAQLRADKTIAWLVWDFRGSNPVFERLIPGRRHVTRRLALLLTADPATPPTLLAHALDAPQFADVTYLGGEPLARVTYRDWRGLRDWLRSQLAESARVAMEYSPGNALPAVAFVDAGTVELIRSFGAQVVSSADLIQTGLARWNAEARAAHDAASRVTEAAKDAAFGLVRERLAAGARVTECEVQALILDRFRAAGLEWADAPIVAVGPHSADPHYSPTPATDTAIGRGDWLLIDLWARHPGNANIFSDITWVAVADAAPTDRQRAVFEAVRAARDAPLARLAEAWHTEPRRQLAGWELDAAASAELVAAGFGDAILHRTGHSLSPGPFVHGLGVNLDDRETRDTRAILPGIGFTIEPGAYFPGEFGVRLEINVFVDPAGGPTITSCVQDEIVTLA